jgi:hypothetical protein
MHVRYINNGGAGFADVVEVAEGTTIAEFFAEKMPGQKAENFMIRLDRQPCSSDEVLRDGSRISITPSKIQGE